MASARSAASARTARNDSRLPWMSERTAYRNGRSGGGPQLAMDAIEDPVDEAPGLLGPELLGDLDRLVDGHLGRYLGRAQELVDGQPQDVAIDHGHPLELPVLGALPDHAIDAVLVGAHAPHDSAGELSRLLVHGMPGPELRLVGRGIGVPAQIELIQELEGDLPSLASPAHDRRPRGCARRTPPSQWPRRPPPARDCPPRPPLAPRPVPRRER